MTQTNQPDWGKRIARATDLAAQHPGTVEVLAFYRRILEFQKTLYDELSARPASAVNRGPAFRQQLEVDTALQQLPALLALVEKNGPSKLAKQAADIGQTSPERQRQMLHDFLLAPEEDETAADSFFARVLFQPQAECLAVNPAAKLAGFSGSVCPVCDGKLQVAVLRPEGNGAKRSLVCSFCATEWDFFRVVCPVCGEEDHPRLPRYAAEGDSVVRVEACDTCKYYLKVVDLTVDGLAVPLVDEIATLPLDLWAAEQGYRKICCNLMGF
jgi:FdhE protein